MTTTPLTAATIRTIIKSKIMSIPNSVINENRNHHGSTLRSKKNSKLFHDYFLKFYNDVFFPYLEKEGITTIVDMGDTFDNRKGRLLCTCMGKGQLLR